MLYNTSVISFRKTAICSPTNKFATIINADSFIIDIVEADWFQQ